MSSVLHGIFFVLTSLDSHSDHPQMCVNVADVPCYDAEFRKKVCWQCCRGGELLAGKFSFTCSQFISGRLAMKMFISVKVFRCVFVSQWTTATCYLL